MIWEMGWQFEVLSAETHIRWSGTATGMYHFGRKKANVENAIFKLGNSGWK